MAGYMPELTFAYASTSRPHSCYTGRTSILRQKKSTVSIHHPHLQQHHDEVAAVATPSVASRVAVESPPLSSLPPHIHSLLSSSRSVRGGERGDEGGELISEVSPHATPSNNNSATTTTMPPTTPLKSLHTAPSTPTPRQTLRQSLRSTSRFFLRRTSPSKSNLTLPPITISPPHNPTAPLSPLTPYYSSDLDAKTVLRKGGDARAKRRKLVKRKYSRMSGAASQGGFGVLAGDCAGESEDEEVEEGGRERGTWSAPPRLKTPRLPELDFGFERREEEGEVEVGEEVPRVYYRCDIHATSGLDFRNAMDECKQIVLESHGHLDAHFEYLSGFLYNLPTTVRNPLCSRDPTEQGGYIMITTWDPFSPPKFDPLRMNPFGGQGDISPTKPRIFAEIAKELHFGSPRARLQRLGRAQSMAQVVQDAKSWRKAESVLGLGRSGSVEYLGSGRGGRASYHPRAGATLEELMDEDDDEEESDAEEFDDGAQDFGEEWESVMSGIDEGGEGGVAI